MRYENWLSKIKKFIGLNNIKTKQTCFVYCPQCNTELISSNSFISDKNFVTYKCKNCKEVSEWDFDSFPIPVLIKKNTKVNISKVSWS